MDVLKRNIIDKLQKEIATMSGINPPANKHALPTGLGFLNDHLPLSTFPVAVHEFICNTPENFAATSGFVLGFLSSVLNIKKSIVWINNGHFVFPPGVAAYYLEPDEITFIHSANEKEALWVVEEVLKCEKIEAVIGQVNELNFTNSRRFQLLIEKSHVPCFLFNSQKKKSSSNACVSRWRISPRASILPNDMPGVGFPSWEVELLKMRNGKPGTWQLAWRGDSFELIKQAEEELNQIFVNRIAV